MRRVFPACAGVVPKLPRFKRRTQRLPRMRGGGPATHLGALFSASSSPHARGWSLCILAHVLPRPVFPACAGVVLDQGDSAMKAAVMMACWSNASSPHARGWSRDVLLGHQRAHVFPACAGVVPRRESPATTRKGLPRMRGGGPVALEQTRRLHESSPHARGWSPISAASKWAMPVFPACAGVVPSNPC